LLNEGDRTHGGSNSVQYKQPADPTMTAAMYGPMYVRTYIHTIQTKLDIEHTSGFST